MATVKNKLSANFGSCLRLFNSYFFFVSWSYFVFCQVGWIHFDSIQSFNKCLPAQVFFFINWNPNIISKHQKYKHSRMNVTEKLINFLFTDLIFICQQRNRGTECVEWFSQHLKNEKLQRSMKQMINKNLNARRWFKCSTRYRQTFIKAATY